MEKDITNEWLEAAFENFDSFAGDGDYQGCLSVIHDVREQGFSKESETLRGLLRAMPLEKFVVRTPYEY